MQHHAHAAPSRAAPPPPHLRAPHAMPPMHPNASAGGPQHMPPPPPMNMGPPKPQQQQKPPQSQQPLPTQQQHHNNRCLPQHPQNLHAANQIQKARPYQRLNQHPYNNNNNNNNHTNKGNLPSQHHFQNHVNLGPPPHMAAAAAQQQQRNQPPHRQHQQQHQHHPQQQQQQQHQHHMPPPAATHIKTTPLQQHVLQTNNMHKQQQQQVLTKVQPPATQTTTQQHNYYALANNKNKYNNNPNEAVATGAVVAATPKTILQNPNRVLKPRLSVTATTTTTGPAVAIQNGLNSSANNVAATTSAAAATGSAAEGSVAAAASVAATSSDTAQDADILMSECNSSNIATEATATTPIVSANVAATNATGKTLKACRALAKFAKPKNSAPAKAAASSQGAAALCNNNNDELDEDDDKLPKEKTPMCLVNELARFNKVSHQYRLTGERGPPHCKRFTVTLTLADEEYTAEGFKIKKAQHLAAAEALEKTKYKHPMPKPIRPMGEISHGRVYITPTVELNALAMKMGQQTYYLYDPRQMPPECMPPPVDGMQPPYGPPPPGALGGHMLPPPHHARMLNPAAFMRRNGGYMPRPPMLHPPHHRYGGPRGYPPKYHQRYPIMPPPHGAHRMPYAAPASSGVCKITLIVGKQKFVGIGRTLQQAKHDAASRALQVLRTQATKQLNEMLNQSMEESDIKSPVSVVHEIGLKRELTVEFKVLREEGPAHMKNFITACIVGDMVTEADGHGKKLAKRRAAEKMLEELKKLPPLTPTSTSTEQLNMIKGNGTPLDSSNEASAADAKPVAHERRKRSIKEKSETELDADNPITKLVQLAQTRKEREPQFELVAKNGNVNARRREFIIEVAAQGVTARGVGNSKRLAKRNAAENLLIALGLESSDGNNAYAPEAATTSVASNSTTPALTADINANSGCSTVTPEVPLPTTTPKLPPAAVCETLPLPTTTTIAKPKLDPVVGETSDEVPVVSTSMGQVPGILILRQSKKFPVKKKEYNTNYAAAPLLIRATPAPVAAARAPVAATPVPVAAIAASVAATPVPVTAIAAPVAATPAPVAATPTPIDTTPASVAVEPPATVTATAATSLTGPANPVATAAAASSASNDSIASENSNSVTAATTSSTNNTSSSNTTAGVHMKDQLLYLSNLLGFEVNFSDYPKGNHNEFLTIVTLSTNPPQICHGVGTSSAESQNDAARNALKILSELGLNNAKK